MTVKTSRAYRTNVFIALLCVALFILIYLLLVGLAVALTALCVSVGFILIVSKPMFLTIVLGLGLASMGVMVIIFLLKFLFKRNQIDRSHLIEIFEQDEPYLFAMIREVVHEVGTQFPKKVYLSADVNASVFYDSGFWSMFLPVKKNLQIGVGLLNSVSVAECKSVLAHEFGHFSQRSMKIGSYVYHVNHILHNLLYDNEGFQQLASSWSGIHSVVSFFIRLSVHIVEGIQQILQWVYKLVNLSYLRLSREMEFHADAVAAQVAGSEPAIRALLRIDLSSQAFQQVLYFYHELHAESKSTHDVYPQHLFLMQKTAETYRLPLVHQLPQPSLQDIDALAETQLLIEDCWSSHPNTRDRVESIQQHAVQKSEGDQRLATELFLNKKQRQEELTKHLFSGIVYPGAVSYLNDVEFEQTYQSKIVAQPYDGIFQGYYNRKNPVAITDADPTDAIHRIGCQSLFYDTMQQQQKELMILSADIDLLQGMTDAANMPKYFRYATQQYTKKDIPNLLHAMKEKKEILIDQVYQNDKNIYLYFQHLAAKSKQSALFEKKYTEFINFDREYDRLTPLYVSIVNQTQFFQQTTAYIEIERNLENLVPAETEIKQEMKCMLDEEIFSSCLTDEHREQLEKYISRDWTYFTRPNYHEDTLRVMREAVEAYLHILGSTYSHLKRELLGFWAALEKGKLGQSSHAN